MDNYLLVPREIVIFIISVSPETSSRETSRYKGPVIMFCYLYSWHGVYCEVIRQDRVKVTSGKFEKKETT